MKAEWNKGDRVYVKPYDCSGAVVKVEWQEELQAAHDE